MVVGYIYEIWCAGRVYVGSTVYPERRERDHLNRLRAGKHANALLQRRYAKYRDFSFRVVSCAHYANDAALREAEAQWTGRYENPLNLRIGGENPVANPITRQKISRTMRARQDEKNPERVIYLRSPDGELVRVDNFKRFCVEQHLDRRSLYQIITGQRNRRSGWELVAVVPLCT